jgi:membrane peptidoglycan carboxypeptidase
MPGEQQQPTNMPSTGHDGSTTPAPSEQQYTQANMRPFLQPLNEPSSNPPSLVVQAKSRPPSRHVQNGRTMYYMGGTRKDSFVRPVKTNPPAREYPAVSKPKRIIDTDTPASESVAVSKPRRMIDTPIPESVALAQAVASVQGNAQAAQQAVKAIRRITRVLPAMDYSTPVQVAPWISPVVPQRLRRKRKLYLRHLSRKHIQQARLTARHAAYRLWLTIASASLICLVVLLSITGAAAYTGYRYYQQAQQYVPRVLVLRDLVPRDNLKMYDSKGVLIGQLTDQGIHTSVTLKQVSVNVINATVAVEDKNFWTNPGFDVMGILRAALADVNSGRPIEGGSTITQQLIKNLVVGNAATVQRKLEELILAPQLNSVYTKSDIMEMYLNTIYYGEQAYGIDAAATVYFGLIDSSDKTAAMQLDVAQAAMLAGLPNSPDAFDPRQHPQAAFARMQTVLTLMEEQHYITQVQAFDALKEAQQPNFFKPAPNLVNRAPHFFNFVLPQLEATFHLTLAQLSRSDLKVYTTLDIALQDKIQKIMQQHVATLRATHNVTNAAEVLIDFHTGAIISLLGSIDYNNASIDGQFDVATQGYRQPGSSFKPYVYVTAFEQGVSPGQAIDDRPLTIDIAGQAPFAPQNYDLRFHGHMTLRCALQNSLNVPAVNVLEHVGIDAAMKTAYDMGVTSYEGMPGYSLVLGGLGVRLIDHTSAYGTFADGGVHVPYYAIQKVVLASTGQTYVHRNNPGTREISPQLAYMMTSVLSDNPDRLPEFYDCNPLQLYSNSQTACYEGKRGTVRPAAAKTGTTTDFRDNWTMGYTTDYVMGVWAGNDNDTPMINITGVDGAAPIWHDAMLAAEQGHPIRNFTNPGGLLWRTVTYPDGVRSSDWYLPGTVPTFAQPTPTPGPSATPTSSATSLLPDVALSPNAPTDSALAQPYCPSSFSFAWQPPGNSFAGEGWW